MALYPRSDLMSVSIPHPEGCGATHMRPVTRGAPAKNWALDCPKCESHLRGDKKPKVIHVYPGDKDKGIPGKTVHVADSDPHWSTSPEGAPLTPDEEGVHRIRAEQGQRQLDQLSAYAALMQAGVDIPPQAKWLINQTLEEIAHQTGLPVSGSVVCADGHDNPPGTKFCSECGMSLSTRAVISPVEELATSLEDLIPLRSLHIATLRKRCREAGLNDKGTKAALIERLGAKV